MNPIDRIRNPLLRAVAREWLAALSAYCMLIAPFGCEFSSSLVDDLAGADEVLTNASTGLFLSDDDANGILLAGRGDSGDAFFVFGTRDAGGGLAQVDAISVQAADGGESFISFESGRPIHAQAADGSYAHVTYTEIGTTRLTALVDLFDAASGATESHAVEIDLEQAAQAVADQVEALTGQSLPVTKNPAKSVSKADARSVRITIFSPLFVLLVVPFIAVMALTTLILGQVLVALVSAVVVLLEATVVAIFAPLFVAARVLSRVVLRTFRTSLHVVFDALPVLPVVIIRT